MCGCRTTCSNRDFAPMSARRHFSRITSGNEAIERASVTVLRLFPTLRATSSCVYPKRSQRAARPSASSQAVRSFRCIFSIKAISATALSSTSISMQGTSLNPAAFEARQRRSPAMIIQRPVMREGLTRRGSNTPFSLIEAVRSFKSPISTRGCSGFGSSWSTAIKRPMGVGWCVASSST
ncbi:MAG: hypothetical protein QOG00_555 [Pyrinomonadaceae bacterium]|nr:hypothetical protein [Pyrinomonadaceae bacterium]